MTDQPTMRDASRSDFPAVVHTYTDALRILRERGASSPAEIANLTERVLSNVRRDLPKLEAAGVVIIAGVDNAPLIDITDKGLKWVAGQDVAEGLTDEPGSSTAGTGLITALHFEMRPDPEQARKDWDSEEAKADFAALKQSLRDKGLKQNLLIRLNHEDDGPDAFGTEPQANRFIIVAGERRWRAIGELIEEGHWPADKPIPAMLEDGTPAEIRAVSLIENLLRRNLNPIEKANGYTELASQLVRDGMEEGKVNGHIAALISKTPEHVQQTRRLLQLDVADQERMTLGKDDLRRMTLREARQKLAAKAQAADDAAKLAGTPIDVRLAYAEFIHRRAIEANYTWADLIVQAVARESETGKTLAELDWVRFTDAPRTYGSDTIGHFTASQGYNAPRLFDWQYSDDADVRDAGLAALRDEAGATATEGYATAWLNPPSERTAEGQALYDESQARSEANRLDQKAREDRDREMRDLWRAARARHAERLALAHAAPVQAAPEETMQIAADIGRPLPWTATDDGKVLDAKGRQIMTFGNYNGCSDQGLVTAQLIVVAANGSAGLATPEAPASEEDGDLDEEDFVDALSVVLSATAETDEEVEAANAAADRLLADFLEENGIEFGDEGFEWTREAAETMAREHLNPEGDLEADEDEVAA